MISFDRLVKEDHMDDLVDMIEYLIQSLQITEKILKLINVFNGYSTCIEHQSY